MTAKFKRINVKALKYISEYVAFALFFAAARFAETKTGIYAAAAPALFAALRRKRNAFVLIPLFVAATALAEPTPVSLISGGVALIAATVLLSAQYFMLRRFPEWLFSFVAVLPAIPRFFFAPPVFALFSVVLSFFALFALSSFLGFVDFPHPPVSAERPALLGAVFIAGFVLSQLNIPPFYAVLPVYIFAARLLSSSFPALASASVSIVAGTLFGGYELAATLAVYAFSAMLTKKHARFEGLAAVAAHAALMALAVLPGEPLSLIAPGVVAVVSLFIPDKKAERFSFPVFGDIMKRASVNKERAAAGRKIAALATAFDALRSALVCDYQGDPAHVAELKHALQNAVCAECPGADRCRKALGGAEPESAFGELMESALKNGKASILDASPFLSSVCVRLKKLMDTAGALAEKELSYETELQKTQQNKQLLIAETAALSNALGALSERVGKPLNFNKTAEKAIAAELVRSLISAEVTVYGDDEALITAPENSDRPAIKAAVEKGLRVRMQCVGEEARSFGRVALTYLKQPRYRLAFGVRQLSAGEFGSGDVQKVFSPARGKALVVLSDGMGHGSEASLNASSAVKIIESFSRAGFDAQTTLECTAKLLSARDREEFNAVDIALINTETGEAELIKQGARESFLLHNGEVDVIECNALPLGIVESAPSVEKFQLTPEHFLIMLSDGILDVLGKEGVADVLTAKGFVNPDDVAEAIMSQYLTAINNHPEDDATVLVSRLI